MENEQINKTSYGHKLWLYLSFTGTGDRGLESGELHKILTP
jgi:hypothetical protein